MIKRFFDHPIVLVIIGCSVAASLVGLGISLQSQPSQDPSDPNQSDAIASPTMANEASETTNLSEPDLSATTTDNDEQSEPSDPESNGVRLMDLPISASSNVEWRDGSIGLEPEGEILFIDPPSGSFDGSFVEYRLDREYQTFSATVGFDDTSPSDSRYLFLVEDEAGNELTSSSFQLGDSKTIEIDVTGVIVLRMRTGFAEDDGGVPYGGEGSVGVANGILTR